MRELSISRGKKHTVLSINLKVRDDKKLEVDMIDKIKEATQWLGEKLEDSTSFSTNKIYLLMMRNHKYFTLL